MNIPYSDPALPVWQAICRGPQNLLAKPVMIEIYFQGFLIQGEGVFSAQHLYPATENNSVRNGKPD